MPFRQGFFALENLRPAKAHGIPRTYQCHALKNFGACLLRATFKRYVHYHGCRGAAPNQSFKADASGAAYCNSSVRCLNYGTS